MHQPTPPAEPILRLTQTVVQDDTFKIDVELTGAGPRVTASARFTFGLSEQEQEDMRWYVEEYAKSPYPPNSQRAARIEQHMHHLGHTLFQQLFGANDRTRRVWTLAAERLDDLRVEVVTDAVQATALPWELLRDPASATHLALQAHTFVRAAPAAPRQALALEEEHIIRILLLICRPARDLDVPFRSVARRLVTGLSAEARALFQLDVLRPPTFERLGQVLRKAKADGKPYHVVHFDGHGAYGLLDQVGKLDVALNALQYHLYWGTQGYLIFEDAAGHQRFIHGVNLGRLLFETDVPLLVLNACRSAHAEQAEPDAAEQPAAAVQPAAPPADDDPYEKVRAFGSLAQQVLLQGVGGVVAMRYNVYVVTAAQFVAELYRALVQGACLGEAVTRGRKHLYEQPTREVLLNQPIPLQDWIVPVVYEAAAMRVFTPPDAATVPPISLPRQGATPGRGMLDDKLPPEPDIGFIGRDEVLLALDRGFDRHHAIVLHAYAGSGKTTTAAEFARWYSLTGGVEGPVLFTSFEQHRTLAAVLDQLGRCFDQMLQQNGIHWGAITDAAQKRDIALQILQRVPVLWVWDNVEPVAGFPAGTPSAWTADEQRELVDFLRAARADPPRARFLLTSRRDEFGWLGDLPLRVKMPPMPLHERRQFAHALAARYGVELAWEVWRPLLVYSGGNPLTLTVVVRQALRDKLQTAQQVAAYVQKLRAGEAAFPDDAREGRSKSLGASLQYGFATAFSADERCTLALLHHFQGFVDGNNALRLMGNPKLPGHLPALAGITREQCIALLDRAAEVGLLTRLGGGYYRIHPALPWFLRQLYQECYPDDAPARAYVEALGELGNSYHDQYGAGNSEVIRLLAAEEANLLHARRLAQQQGWYLAIMKTMQGLRNFYAHTGRRAEWRRLVAEIVPVFVDPATDGPLPGRAAQWSLVTDYRVRLLMEERQWAEAARLQGLRTEYNRQRAAPLLALPPEHLDTSQRNTLRSLAVSVEALGHIQREQGAAACVASYQESYDLALRIGEQAVAAACAFNLGRVYGGNVNLVPLSRPHDNQNT